jgi:hypothetical protein
VHSRYQRRVADAPIAGTQVVIGLEVGRLFCDCSGCPKRTFVEQVPGLTARYARRGPGLGRMLAAVGLALAGRAGDVEPAAAAVGGCLQGSQVGSDRRVVPRHRREIEDHVQGRLELLPLRRRSSDELDGVGGVDAGEWGGCGGDRCGVAPAVVHQTTVVSPAEPLLEFADSELESRGDVGAVRFGAHRRASSAAGYLDPVARLGPARVLLVVDHDVEMDDVAAVALETGQSLGNVRAIVCGRLDVAPCHDDLHLVVRGVLGRSRFHVTPMLGWECSSSG